jgi:serine/threonine-protein kinase
VALRIVAGDVARDPTIRARLNRESTALAALDHPNVAPIFEAGEYEGRLFVATRWVDGISLGSLVRRDGPLPARRAVAIVNQVASALQASHAQGIIHRNVKPSAVLVTASDFVYLTDFGLARRSGDLTGLTIQEQLLESFDYVAPEYLEGDSVDKRVDIYGLGCVLYEALTAEPPYPYESAAAKMYAHQSAPPPSAHDRVADVPAALDHVIARAMAKDPADRYQSPGDFAIDAATALGTSAPPWATRPQSSRSQLDGGGGARALRPGAGIPSYGSGAVRPQPGAGLQVVAQKGGDRPAEPFNLGIRNQEGYSEPVYYTVRRLNRRRLVLWGTALVLFIAPPVGLLLFLAAHP